ncbi:TraB/GumN family protein [Ureibacillus acetophenoni]|uniref:TraB family protein n=1 Tax=Ureibacillus acetophenoni TaxID=614649 RepID=A0A285U0D7_9BACL|nr:TraB/GumN family protein [Ureibacillus acetophenoni]SOC34858.1 hypothetical protein SAMN05877842_101132 [Ureibacillus acetophenoni]
MKKILKHLMAPVLGATLVLSTVVPTIQAEETATAPDISIWAIETLNEGEKYGIYPMEWYYDGFRTEASIDRVNQLISLTEQKIASLQLPANTEFQPVSIQEDTTRGDIVNRLYNIVAQYDLPVGADPVAHMTERNILRGTGTGLALDKNATTEDAVILAVRFIKDTYHLAGEGSKGVAWTVEDEDTLVYLLGSIHLGTPDLYPFNEKLLNAFEESEALLVEANVLDQAGMEYYLENAMFEEGTTLKDVVSEETFAKVEQVAEMYQIPLEQLVMFQPWALSSDLAILSMDDSFGISPQEMSMHGIDMYFLLNAMLQGKPVIELEGMQAQVDMFTGLSPEAQEEVLVAALDSILDPSTESEYDSLKEWFDYWKNGDVAAWTESFNASVAEANATASEYDAMLFGDRDEQMAQKIATLLEEQEGTYFVVVGAGHFIVDKNIRYHLEQSGYTVEPLYQ